MVANGTARIRARSEQTTFVSAIAAAGRLRGCVSLIVAECTVIVNMIGLTKPLRARSSWRTFDRGHRGRGRSRVLSTAIALARDFAALWILCCEHNRWDDLLRRES
jgi:hypothetical protein